MQDIFIWGLIGYHIFMIMLLNNNNQFINFNQLIDQSINQLINFLNFF